MGSLSEEGTFIFAFREAPQIIFQGDTSTQSEITRNPRLHEEKYKYNIWEEQVNTNFRYYNSQTGFKNFCTQDLKLDNSYRKQKINFLKNIENLERNQTGLLEISPTTPMKNQPLISDTWPGNRRCYLVGKLFGPANRPFSQRLVSFCHQGAWGKELPYEDTYHCPVTLFWYVTLSSSGFVLFLHLCSVKLNLFNEHLQIICCMLGGIS